MTGATKESAIVRSVIALAHLLELVVVGEGVEEARAQSILAALGCDVVQGYHVCHPVPPAELQRWLQSRPLSLRAVPAPMHTTQGEKVLPRVG